MNIGYAYITRFASHSKTAVGKATGFLKSLFVPPSAAEEGGKLSGDTWGQRPARPGRGYRPCTPFSATFEKP